MRGFGHLSIDGIESACRWCWHAARRRRYRLGFRGTDRRLYSSFIFIRVRSRQRTSCTDASRGWH